MSELRVESIIFENLINNEEFFRAAIPHLEEEYFGNRIDRTILKFIKAFATRHNKAPNTKILGLLAKEFTEFSQEEYAAASEHIKSLSGKEENLVWLLDRTEKFCQEKAVYNSIMQAIKIMDGEGGDLDKGAIPGILQTALGISFDKSVGHDFFDNSEERFDFYHKNEDRIQFRLDLFNKITKQGTPRKTLNCVLAGVNVGKSLFLCDIAAGALSKGYNVLYITLEMAEEKIAERIDCNMLDVEIDSLYRMKHDDFVGGIDAIEKKTHGRLVIKEYPTGGANVSHFRALLEELKLKKNFLPDLICIDYINICSSLKYKSTNFNSYFAIKAIAEELRGLMVEYNCVGWTATQLTRTGFSDSDFDMTDTSESFGLPATLDFLVGIIRTDELDKMNQLMVKQLKSRYNDVNYFKKFLIGVDIRKFKLRNLDDSVQGKLDDAGYNDFTKPVSVSSLNTSEIQFD